MRNQLSISHIYVAAAEVVDTYGVVNGTGSINRSNTPDGQHSILSFERKLAALTTAEAQNLAVRELWIQLLEPCSARLKLCDPLVSEVSVQYTDQV